MRCPSNWGICQLSSLGGANRLLKGWAHMNWLLKEGFISEKLWIVFKCCPFPATLAAERLSPAFGLTCRRLLRSHFACQELKKRRISRSCVGHRQLSRRGAGESVPPPPQTKNLGWSRKTLLRMYLTIPVT